MHITPIEVVEMIDKCKHIIIKEGSNTFSVEIFRISRDHATHDSPFPFLMLKWVCYQDFDGDKAVITYERFFEWCYNRSVEIDGCSMYLMPNEGGKEIELNLFYDPMNLEDYYNWNIK